MGVGREPQRAVGADGDLARHRARRHRVLGDRPRRRHRGDHVAQRLGDPDPPVGPGDEPPELRPDLPRRRRRQRDVRERAGGGHAAERVRRGLRHPQRAVGARGDVGGPRARVVDEAERARRVDAPDAVAEVLGEPQRAVGAERDAVPGARRRARAPAAASARRRA